jgi:hypothetical protein
MSPLLKLSWTSVPDPQHFETDPDPRIRTTGPRIRIRILLFSLANQKLIFS